MSSKKPTLQDVAQASGFSTATISRCLNQPNKVKESVREKIHDAINTLGYVPHGAARALASSKTHTIGIIVPTIDNLIFAKAIQQVQDGLAKHKYTLLVASSAYSLEDELREVQSLLTRGIDGLILIGEQHHPAVFKALERHSMPHVNLWTYNNASEYSCIGFDHIEAGGLIARHIHELGHQNISFISGYLENNDRAQLRLDGVKKYLKSQNLEITSENLIECRYSIEEGLQAFKTLIAKDNTITAVICGNDILAIGALVAARDLKLRVPEDISISGFDNIDITSALDKPLTTISVPAKEMGAQAAQYLLQEIQEKTQTIKRIELKTHLVVGETTSSPSD